jgi:hypothetical protein
MKALHDTPIKVRISRPLRLSRYPPGRYGCANSSRIQGFDRGVMLHARCSIFTSANRSWASFPWNGGRDIIHQELCTPRVALSQVATVIYVIRSSVSLVAEFDPTISQPVQRCLSAGSTILAAIRHSRVIHILRNSSAGLPRAHATNTFEDIFGLFEPYSCCHCSCLTTYCSLRKFVDLVGALEHLHDLLHDLRLHALGLLELLAVAVDDSGGSLGDTEVLLM